MYEKVCFRISYEHYIERRNYYYRSYEFIHLYIYYFAKHSHMHNAKREDIDMRKDTLLYGHTS